MLKPLSTTLEASRFLAISKHTLDNSRCTGKLMGLPAPAHIKFGYAVRYKKETLEAVAAIIGDGYKCYASEATGEVLKAEEINLEARKEGNFKEYVPLEGPITFKMMEEYVASVEDFGKQSELLETLLYEQPFQTFKRKVYAIGLADEWIAFRTQKIVAIIG